MNRSFRLVWSVSQGLWVVASEAAKGKSKSKTISSTKISIKEKRAQKIAMTLLTAGAAFIAAPTWAGEVKSTATGFWGNENSWDTQIPDADSDITISAGDLIGVVENVTTLGKSLTVNGTLAMGNQTTGTSQLLGGTVDVVTGDNGKVIFQHTEESYDFSNKITGSGAVEIKNGTTVFSAENTYTGSTTIFGGTLSIADEKNLGTGALTLSGGTLAVTGDTTLEKAVTLTADKTSTVSIASDKTVTASGVISGSGALTKSGAGTLILSNTSSNYSGTTTVTAGTLKAGAENAFSSESGFVVNGGTLDLNNNNQTLKSLAGTSTDAEVKLGSATLLLNQTSNTEYQGKITGTGALTKSGAGTLTLSGANTYTGNTTVNQGKLQLGNGDTDGSIASDVSVADGASIIFNNKNAQGYSKVISGDGTLTKSGAGTLTLTGANTYKGDTTVSGGALQLGDGDTDGSIDSYVSVADGASIIFNNKNTQGYSKAISGDGALTKSGTGKLTLTGNNTYKGDTTVSAGVLQIGNRAGDGGSIASNVIVEASAIVVFHTEISDEEYNKKISGDGSLAKSGDNKLTLTGENTFKGGTTISGGTLQIGNGGTTGSVTGDIGLASETKLNFNRSDAVTFGGNITGSGDVFINSGTVSFAKGVSGTNSLTNKAILSIADGKTTSVGGDYTQESSGTLKVGASSLTSFGKLKVKNTATFAKNSKIDVDVTKANSLAAGSMTKVVEAGTLKSEGFVVKDNSALFDFSAVVDGNNVNLTVVQGTDDSSTDDSSTDDSSTDKPASSEEKVTVLKYVQSQGSSASIGAATVLDKFVQGGKTGTAMDDVVTALGKLATGKEVNDAVAQTLPLLSGSSTNVSAGVMQSNSNVVATRQSGASSGDGFISDGHAWVKPVGSWAKQDSRNGVSGYDASTYGIIGGMDGDINDTTTVGLALSYMNSSVDGKGTNTTNEADIDAYQVMFYGQRNLGEAFHNVDVSWQAGAGVNKTDGTRNINFMGSKAKSDYTSYTGNLSAGLGRTFTINSDTSLAPSVRASYSYIKDESYKETGADALNLNVDSNTADSFILSVQGDLNQRLSDSLTLDSNVSVGYDVINDAASLTASYAGGGAAFKTEGLELSPWIMTAGLGVNYALDDATKITVRYDLEGRSDFLSQTATAKFKWMF